MQNALQIMSDSGLLQTIIMAFNVCSNCCGDSAHSTGAQVS